jgi:hypothetical protein
MTSPFFAQLPTGSIVSTTLVPYWIPVLLTATLAALPWLRWRFSLKALMIGTTLVAVLMGLIVWAVR